VAFLRRAAWGGFGGLAWHPPIALTGWDLVELASSGCTHQYTSETTHQYTSETTHQYTSETNDDGLVF
jgi:hypothetical protein